MKKHYLSTISLLFLWMPISFCQSSQEFKLGTYTKFRVTDETTNKTFKWLSKELNGLLLTKEVATYNKHYNKELKNDNLYFLSLQEPDSHNLSKQGKGHIHVIATKRKMKNTGALPIRKLGFSPNISEKEFLHEWDPDDQPVAFKPIKFFIQKNKNGDKIPVRVFDEKLPIFPADKSYPKIFVYGFLMGPKSTSSNLSDTSQDLSQIRLPQLKLPNHSLISPLSSPKIYIVIFLLFIINLARSCKKAQKKAKPTQPSLKTSSKKEVSKHNSQSQNHLLVR